MDSVQFVVPQQVLVVEDEQLVAMLVEDMLVDIGCAAIEFASTVKTGLLAVERCNPDVAILDVNLNGEQSYPIAEALRAKGVPFIFATGYGASAAGTAYHDIPVLQKPFVQAELESALARAVVRPTGLDGDCYG